MTGRLRTWLSRALLAVAIPLLFSCGGGGGGGEGGGNGGRSFTVSTTTVTFSAALGSARPAAQVVEVAVTSGTVFIGTAQTGSGFIHTFNITGQTTAQVTITPDFPNNAGTFTGTVIVTGCVDQFCSQQVSGSPKVINVTYNVSGVLAPTVTPNSLSFTSNIGAIPASQDVTVRMNNGALTAWTASAVNYTSGTSGWLTVSPTSGTTPQPVTFTVNSAPSVAEVRTATVTFTAASQTKTVDVTYVVTGPGVNFVAPYVGTTGVPGHLYIRGHGFSTLNSGTAQVQIGAAATVPAAVEHDAQIQASYPALAAGSYTITVTDGTTTLPTRSGVKLVITDPPAFAQATVVRGSSPGGVGSLVYDAERQFLFLLDADNNRLYRYRMVSGAWTEESTPSIDGGLNNRIALSPDGAVLLQTGGSSLTEWNPATMSPAFNVGALTFLGSGALVNMIAFANDGMAVGNASAGANGVTLYSYDLLTRTFAELSSPSLSTFDLANRSIAAAANGSVLILPSYKPLAPGSEEQLVYIRNLGLFTASVLNSGTSAVSVSADGSRSIMVNFPLSGIQVTKVYDFTFTALGDLPSGLSAFAISPDGSTAWAYFPSTNRVRRFDLNSPSGGGFTEVGVGTVVASPGAFFSAMTVSPDGGTLFLAGRDRVIILSAP